MPDALDTSVPAVREAFEYEEEKHPRDDKGRWMSGGLHGVTVRVLGDPSDPHTFVLSLPNGRGHVDLEPPSPASDGPRGYLSIAYTNITTPRQGDGSKLYQAALAYAHDHGFRGIASVQGDRNMGSDALWKSLGRTYRIGTKTGNDDREYDVIEASRNVGRFDVSEDDIRHEQFDPEFEAKHRPAATEEATHRYNVRLAADPNGAMTFDFDEDKHPRDDKGRWTSGGTYVGYKPRRGFKPTVRETRFDFKSQVGQYPKAGPKGISYFRGDLGEQGYVDTLLYRKTKDGPIVGIINHYPQDIVSDQRYMGVRVLIEAKGNINILVDPKQQHQGIGAALIREAGKRWDIDLFRQDYTKAGAALVNSVTRAKLTPEEKRRHARWKDFNFGAERFYSEDQARDEHGRWTKGGESAVLDAAPADWRRSVTADARSRQAKAGWNAKDIYFAIGHRLDRGDERGADNFYSMAYHVEKASSRETMYDIIGSGLNWNTNYASGGMEWAAAVALGANPDRAKGLPPLPTLTDEQVAAFRARTEWVQEFVKRTEGETFDLYRGVSGRYSTKLLDAWDKEDKRVNPPSLTRPEMDVPFAAGVRGLTSWTPDRYLAQDFARAKGIVLKSTIPVKDVFWTNDLVSSARVLRFSDDHGEIITLNREKTRTVTFETRGHKPRRNSPSFFAVEEPPEGESPFTDDDEDRAWREFLIEQRQPLPDDESGEKFDFDESQHPRDEHGRWALVAAEMAGSPKSDRVPPYMSDPVPGEKYEYHATNLSHLEAISKQGLTAPPHALGWISTSGSTEGASFYAMTIAGRSDRGEAIVLRMERGSGIRIEYPDDEGTFHRTTTREDEIAMGETREHVVKAPVSPDKLEVYFRGEWHRVGHVKFSAGEAEEQFGNPNHEPAGSSHGGEFAPKDSGGDAGLPSEGAKGLTQIIASAEGGKASGTVVVYRAGEATEAKNGFFFGDSPESVSGYAKIHEERTGQHAPVRPFEVTFKNAAVEGHQHQLWSRLFPTKGAWNEAVHDADVKSKNNPPGWMIIDARMMREAKRQGYDAIIYSKPAAPAKHELIAFDKRQIRPLDGGRFSAEQFEAKPKPTPSLFVPAPGIDDVLRSIYAEAYGSGAEALAAARGTEAAMAEAQDAAAAYADDRAGSLITDIDDSTEERVQGIIASSIQDGDSDVEVADRLKTLFGDDRAELIANTEMTVAWNQGVGRALRDAGEDYIFVTDGDGCDVCAQIGEEGQIWEVQEFLDNPSEHPHCFPSDVLVSAPDRMLGMERRYDGELVVLHTAASKLLPVTPNHPILTTKGWLPAKAIRQGDYVLRSSGPGLWAATADTNEYEAPSPIEQVARSPKVASREPPFTAVHPTRSDDFHGDGKGSQVYVEWPLGLLPRREEAELAKRRAHLSLGRGYVRAGTLVRLRPKHHLFKRLLASSRGDVCGFHLLMTLGKRSLRPDQALHLRERARLHADVSQPAGDRLPNYPTARRNLRLRQLLHYVHSTKHRVWRTEVRPTERMPSATDSAGDGLPIRRRSETTAEALPNLLNALSGLVTPEKVVAVGSCWYGGQVFNLQTKNNWYVAGNYISHNCIREGRPLTEEELAEARADEREGFGARARQRDRSLAERFNALEEQFIRVVGPYARRGLFYSEDQLRDERGRWAGGGTEGAAAEVATRHGQHKEAADYHAAAAKALTSRGMKEAAKAHRDAAYLHKDAAYDIARTGLSGMSSSGLARDGSKAAHEETRRLDGKQGGIGAYTEPPFGAAVDRMFREDRSRGIKTRSLILYEGKFDDHLEHVRGAMKAAGYKETNGMGLELPGVKDGAELQYKKDGKELNVYMRSNGRVTALTADETPMDSGGRLHTTDNFIPEHLRDVLTPRSKRYAAEQFEFDEDLHPRDDHGRWASSAHPSGLPAHDTDFGRATHHDTVESADAWGQATQGWAASMTPEQEAALNHYTNYVGMNDSLRGARPLSETAPRRDSTVSDSTALAPLDSLFANPESALKEDVVTHRAWMGYRGKPIGKEFSDRGFTSTALVLGNTEDFMRQSVGGGAKDRIATLVDIRVPAGTRALYLGSKPEGKNWFAASTELLLDRGTKFRVVGQFPGRFDPGVETREWSRRQEKYVYGKGAYVPGRVVLEVVGQRGRKKFGEEEFIDWGEREFDAEYDESLHPRDELGRWTHGNAGEVAPPENPYADRDHLDALINYTAGSSLNELLREGAPLARYPMDNVAKLDDLMLPSSADRTLHRVMSDIYAKDFRPGTQFTDHGFCSTSMVPVTASSLWDGGPGGYGPPPEGGKWATLEIEAPKGTLGLDVNHYVENNKDFQFRFQRELILGRDTEFRVDSVTHTRSGPVFRLSIVAQTSH